MITKVCKCPIPVTAYCHACGGLVKEKDNKKTLREEFKKEFEDKLLVKVWVYRGNGYMTKNEAEKRKSKTNDGIEVEVKEMWKPFYELTQRGKNSIWNWFESKINQREAEVRGGMKRPIDTEIVDHLIKIIGNGTFRVETINESVLVKMLELRGTPIPIERTLRDIDKDYKGYLEDVKSLNQNTNERRTNTGR